MDTNEHYYQVKMRPVFSREKTAPKEEQEKKDIGVSKAYHGLIFTVRSFEENATIKCSDQCIYKHKEDGSNIFHCRLKENLSIPQNKSSFVVNKARITLINESGSEKWHIEGRDIRLQDEEGYVYEGFILCNSLLSTREVGENYCMNVGSKVDYVELYPPLPTGVRVSKLLVKVDNHTLKFAIGVEEKLLHNINLDKKSESISNEASHSHYQEIESILYVDKLNQIKRRVFERLNNILTSAEEIKLENTIRSLVYSLKLELNSDQENVTTGIMSELDKVVQDYQTELETQKQNQSFKRSIKKTVESLYELSPREFEEYIGQLLSDLGYEDVVLTPYSNDKGIDLFAQKDGCKIAVQCKKYKGSVGSPEIQTFIGAMTNAEADKGIFITTGMFTFEAEKMANNHPIQLVNRIDLATLILGALNKPKEA